MSSRRGLWPATFAVAFLLAACGTSGEVGEAAAARLEPQVQAVRQAAASGRADVARTELAELRAMAEGLAAAGDVDEIALERILAAAADVEAGLALLATTTTTTTTAATATTTTIEAPRTDAPGRDDKEDGDEGGSGADQDEKDQDEKDGDEKDADEKDADEKDEGEKDQQESGDGPPPAQGNGQDDKRGG